MAVTLDLMRNSSRESRLAFHEIILTLKDISGADYIYEQYCQGGYEDIALNQGSWSTTGEASPNHLGIVEAVRKDDVETL